MMCQRMSIATYPRSHEVIIIIIPGPAEKENKRHKEDMNNLPAFSFLFIGGKNSPIR